MTINGQPFNYDPQQPMLVQIQAMLKNNGNTARKNPWMNLLVNEAYADQENPAAASLISLSLAAGTFYSGATAFFSLAFSGVVSPVAAVPAALGVGAAALGCVAGQNWMHGTSFKQRYLNCAASPLSWFGINPRDNLYLRKFENCSPDKISAIVTSPNGSEQKREFIFSNGKLVTVRMTNLKTSETATLSANQSGNALLSGQVSSKEMKDRALSSDQVIEAQSLLRDAQYYRGVCNNPERRDRIEAGLADGDRAYDTSTPGEMLKNAPAAK